MDLGFTDSGNTPNDLKLSDCGGQARRLPVVVRWWRSLAAAVTGRSRSLQRMVRRCGRSRIRPKIVFLRAFVVCFFRKAFIAAKYFLPLRLLELRMRLFELRMLVSKFHMVLSKARIICLKSGYLSGDEPNLRSNFVLCCAAVNHPVEIINVFVEGFHLVNRDLRVMRLTRATPNEIKLSDRRPPVRCSAWVEDRE